MAQSALHVWHVGLEPPAYKLGRKIIGALPAMLSCCCICSSDEWRRALGMMGREGLERERSRISFAMADGLGVSAGAMTGKRSGLIL